MYSEYETFQAICRQDLYAYTQKAFSLIEPGRPFEDNWSIGCISEHLQAVHEGEIRDLIINEPPRMLKSVQVAQIYPSWVFIHDPSHQFIGASYAHSLAERNVMKARYLLQSDFYQELAPNTIISQDQNKKDFFTTDKNGQYKGTGIGGTITGFGADTLLIDDPINPKEAMSDTIRVSTNEEVRSTLFSRFNDIRVGKKILIMQRVHEEDTTGEMLADGGYFHLKLPAYTKTYISFDLTRGGKKFHWEMKEDTYLSPRLGKEELSKLEIQLGTYHFHGQYYQDPVPMGGGELKEEWVQFYQAGGVKPKEMNVVILVDPAGGEELNKKKKKLSDWTAFIVVGLGPDNNYYVLDIIRDRLNPTERVDTLFQLHRKWNGLCAKPPKVGYEKYGMMTDTHYITKKQKEEAYNFSLIELGGAMEKTERIRRLVPDLQNGRWYLPSSLIYMDIDGRRFDLVQELIKSEMKKFPKSRFDDMLDALSRIYEPELNMFFPKPKTTMVQKAMTGASPVIDWRD